MKFIDSCAFACIQEERREGFRCRDNSNLCRNTTTFWPAMSSARRRHGVRRSRAVSGQRVCQGFLLRSCDVFLFAADALEITVRCAGMRKHEVHCSKSTLNNWFLWWPILWKPTEAPVWGAGMHLSVCEPTFWELTLWQPTVAPISGLVRTYLVGKKQCRGAFNSRVV